MLKPKNAFGEQYQLKKIIDAQGLAEVWEAIATKTETNEIVALKIFPKLEDATIVELENNIFNQKNFDYHNLLPAKHIGIYNNQLFFEMQFCSNGTVKDKAGEMNEKELAKCLYQTASAVAFLHNQSILHQYLKPENILIEGNNYFCYLPDLGFDPALRKTISDNLFSENLYGNKIFYKSINGNGFRAIPAAYQAPELFLTGTVPTVANDIWAMGAIMYELACKKLPFGSLGGEDQRKDAEPENLPKSFSPNLNRLIKKCLAFNPADRPDAEEIAQTIANYFNTGSYKLPFKNEEQFTEQPVNYPLIFLNDIPVPKSNRWKKLTLGVVSLTVIGASVYYLIGDNLFTTKSESVELSPVSVKDKPVKQKKENIKNDTVAVKNTVVVKDTTAIVITPKVSPSFKKQVVVIPLAPTPVPTLAPTPALTPAPKVIKRQLSIKTISKNTEIFKAALPVKKIIPKVIKPKEPKPAKELGIPTRRDSEQEPK